MEENFSCDKENVIGRIDCSPVLPVAKERIVSSLSPLQESRQNNVFNSPRLERSTGLSSTVEKPVPEKANLRFLSTPLRPSAEQTSPSNLWEDIRKLDEEEDWVERTQVVTKEDHILYCEVAKEVVNSIIGNLPVYSSMEDIDSTEPSSSVLEENNGDDTIVSGEDKENLITDSIINTEQATTKPKETNGDNVIVSGEEKENLVTDAITLDTDDPQPSNQYSEKSILEDNDFIYSCSNLDETVKEILEDEEPISPKKFDDIDGDKTICENINGEKNEENFDAKVSEDPLKPIEDPNLQSKFNDHPLNSVEDPDFGMNFDEESFKPATGQAFALELDYLENLAQSEDTEHMSDLARDSLYVKFDPLVGAGNSTAQQNQDLSDLARIKPADILFPGPISGADLLVMDTPPKKPVQSRVPDMTAQATSEEQKPSEDSRVAPIDRLFEFSPEKIDTSCSSDKPEVEDTRKYNGSEAQHDSSLVEPLLYSKNDLDKAVADEKDRLIAQWKEESAFSELEIKELTGKVEKLVLEKGKALDEIEEMKNVMSEYEQTMAKMIEDREKEKSDHAKSNSAFIQERDQLQHDLHNTEKSFAHLHTRFEKLKAAVEGYRKNEEILKKAVKDLQESNKKSEGKYQGLKKHAEEKLHDANAEVSRLQSSNKNEVAVLQAALKKERAKISSLQQSLDQKVNENKELTAICDELISKIGPLQ